ncbi:CCD81-like protein [Mya arenaria]|uniref:CCD81-like protein n=1 Tax=Mya arenaria TaxID=6604 RepID=A0ABY7EGC4_MYAAR|nr:CCD81-like protein [Mya arenaria]
MTDVMQGILAEAKKNKYSTIRDNLSEDDVAAVWESVSSFVEKQMGQQKGVQIQSLGTFTFTQKKLDIGNNKFLLIQRPVFNISEKLAQSQGLQYVKHHVPGQIPVVQLNYAAMSFESPYDRDTVESCVREILGAVQRAIGAKRNVELSFSGIGKLAIRDSRVKMKFYKDFINQMDGSGKLLDSMQNRPGTVDSVMSDRCLSRAQSSNTLILPRISNTNIAHVNGGLPPLEEAAEVQDSGVPMDYDNGMGEQEAYQPPVNYMSNPDGMDGPGIDDMATDAAVRHIEMGAEDVAQAGPSFMDADTRPDPLKRASIPPSRAGSRMAAPMAMATGVSLLDDLVPSAHTPKSAPSIASQQPSPPPGDMLYKPQPPAQLAPLHRSVSFDQMKPGERVVSPAGSMCGHSNAGQELCYLCHQRARRNVPVSFTEERRRREEEEDRLLQQYQYMKDAENVLSDQEMQMAKRNNLQRMAAFNLGVSEAVHHKKRDRDTAFHVDHKESVRVKKQTDEDFLERLEQVQLAEEYVHMSNLLAIQEDRGSRGARSRVNTALSSPTYTIRLPKINTVRPFTEPSPTRLNESWKPFCSRLRFKPLQVPAREPDKEVFGKNDMTNEKMAERRRRAFELFQEQQDLVAQRKREAILKRLAEQKEEEQFSRRLNLRKRLEQDWTRASLVKRDRLEEDKVRALSPGMLLHEQCDKYNRCAQCKRQTKNCGESNLWSESRYIPGSRLMV